MPDLHQDGIHEDALEPLEKEAAAEEPASAGNGKQTKQTKAKAKGKAKAKAKAKSKAKCKAQAKSKIPANGKPKAKAKCKAGADDKNGPMPEDPSQPGPLPRAGKRKAQQPNEHKLHVELPQYKYSTWSVYWTKHAVGLKLRNTEVDSGKQAP